ncbi:MAG: ATP-binding cassette domain-containing protein [Deltaproteobacteria bacterium]|jgi:ABC-type multidrug transport system ATPase subunit|nr:ATP-binding cassette domain-containing protein [Deltaproteobacteria bacterium]MBW2479257.1 ATP-binding cassette domain-containing protein [Deltaproteobacteria bacterium]
MLLEFKDITYKYPGAVNEVFKDLSCSISAPGFHSLFGPSGVGKTTLAKMMIGGINGFSGEIITRGVDHILYTYNLERLPGWSSVREHFQSTTPVASKGKIDELAAAFGLEPCMNSRFAQLSLGQQNRTNLARYLLQDFDLLIMDESLANVDEVTKEKIILTMKAIFPDRCFLYISHSVAEVAKFCQQILVLRGRHRSPQTISLLGQDHSDGKAIIKKDLEQTMLEIVNAA